MIDDPIFCGLAVLFTILTLFCLRSLLKITPSLMDCVRRWKGNIDLEDSLQLSRSRNLIALVLFVPLCMVAYSHSLYTPEFLESLPQTLQFGIVTGILSTYVLLRLFLNWQLEFNGYESKVFSAANRSFYNYLIILFFLLFIPGTALNAADCPEETSRTVLLWITAVSYGFFVIRRGQIFASACNPFTTILYLCGLEILPTAALVFSAYLL